MSKMKIGVNVFSSKIEEGHPSIEIPFQKGGFDFTVCHFSPGEYTVKEACAKIKQVMEKCREKGVEIIVNHEWQNFQHDCVGKDGWDWADGGDGCHRLNLPDEYKQTLASQENCVGIMYDEFEHTIINRNLSLELASKGKIKENVFPLLKEKNIIKQGELLSNQLKEYADSIKEKGVKTFCGEHVFPVLFHTFARNGITPNFKSQKESYSNVQYAVAAGAALEYNTELFNCVDLWYRLKCPGHTPKEMFSNLCFAFLAGVDRVYVETAHHFVDKDKNGNDVYNEYGKKYSEFAKNYRNASRDYSVRDYRPEIGIIRYDSAFWGQKDPVMWKYMLFGNKDIKPVKQSYEWLQAMHTVTHGETSKYGISWSKISPWSLRKHRSFASMNGAAVFDDRVRRDKLESLNLCFLCGESIEKETLADVYSLVKDGLTVVTPKRFLPDELKSRANGAYSEIPDGKGKWMVSENLCSRRVRKNAAPFLGNKGEIKLRFGENRVVRLKIDKNGEGFTVLKR